MVLMNIFDAINDLFEIEAGPIFIDGRVLDIFVEFAFRC